MSKKSRVMSIRGRLFTLVRIDAWTSEIRPMNSERCVGKVRRDRRNQRRIWSVTWDGIDLFDHSSERDAANAVVQDFDSCPTLSPASDTP